MPLINILSEIAANCGIDTKNTNERANLLFKINEAAKELYDSTDLPGSLYEQIFNISLQNKQVALPWYVDNIRAMRYYDNRQGVIINNQLPRYSTGAWRTENNFKFRLRKKLPTHTQLLNASALTLTIPQSDNSFSFKVYIVGTTSTSARVQEEVDFPIGATTRQTTNSFLNDFNLYSIEAINKSSVCTYDVTVKNADGVEIAKIPNHQLYVDYCILQVQNDDVDLTVEDDCIEVLFKIKQQNFVNDYDSFICGNQFDRVIAWKFMEAYYALKPDGASSAIAAGNKAQQVLDSVINNIDNSVQKPIDFGRNGYLNLMQYPFSGYNSRRGYGFTGRRF